MDANKIAKLKDAEYKIEDACVLCKAFRPGAGMWGTCRKHRYQHEKHTGVPRECSVVVFGHCPDFEGDEAKVATILGKYVCLAKEQR